MTEHPVRVAKPLSGDQEVLTYTPRYPADHHPWLGTGKRWSHSEVLETTPAGSPNGVLYGDARIPEHTWQKIYPEPNTGCWLWAGALTSGNGEYASISLNGRMRPGHIALYVVLVGAVPEGRELDHLCRMPSCVNPDHLEPVTHRVNLLRGTSYVAVNAAKTHCVNGHEFTAENTALRREVDGTYRRCRTCDRSRARRRYRKAAA